MHNETEYSEQPNFPPNATEKLRMRVAILVLAVAVSAFAKTISVGDVKNWDLITDTSENDTDVSDGSLFGNDNDTSVLEQVQEVIENSGDHVVEFLTIGFVCTEKCVSEWLNFLPCLNKCADEEWNKRHPNNETIEVTTVAPNVTTTIAPTNSSSRNLATSETPKKDAEVVTDDWLAQTKAECTKACKDTKRAAFCLAKCVDDRTYLLRPEISDRVKSVLAECKAKVGDMKEFIDCATDLFFAAHREFKPAGLEKINLPPINDKLIEDLNNTIHLCRERCGETDVVVFIFSSCAKTCVHDEFIKLHPEFASIKVPADRNPFPHFQDDDVLDSSLTFEESERPDKKMEGENQVKVKVDSLPKSKGLMTGCEDQCVTSTNQESCLLLCQAELILANLRRMSGKSSEIETRQHFTSKFQFGGVFTEMAEEITSILDGVVFRQQEMMQMLIGCKCAGSTTNVTVEEEPEDEDEDDEAPVVEDATVTESEVDAFVIETVNKLPGETVTKAPTNTVTLAPVQIVTTPETGVIDPVTEAVVVEPVTVVPAQSVTETLVAETVTETVTTAPAEVLPEVPEEIVTEAVVVVAETSSKVPEESITKVPEPVTEAQTQLVTETVVAETAVTKAPEELVTDSVVATVTETPAQSVTEAPAETMTKEPVQSVSEGTVTEAEENHKEETSQVPDALMK